MPPGDQPGPQGLLDQLRRQIISGQLAAGARLPSIRELADAYTVDTNTVRRIINELVDGGLVEKRHGSGTYVRAFLAIPRSSPGRLARERWGLGHTIQDADTGTRPRAVNVHTGEATAPDWATSALGLPPAAVAAFRDRRYVVDDRPVQLATSWLPVDIARGTPIMHTDTGPGGTYARLADLGHAPVTFTEYVRARMPLPEEEERLPLPPGTPVMEITRHAFDEQGRCVEVNRMVLDGMAYLVDYTFPA